MRAIIEFGKNWYTDAADELRRADPLLMGAAFAFNSLFAVVPLALAFVSTLTLFDRTQEVLDNTYVFLEEALPPDIAGFLTQILVDSVASVENNRAAIIVVTVLIALWSGSRAVYTVQKALRLVEDPDSEVGYVRMRSTGILVTVGAGAGVIVGYTAVVFGTRISEMIESWIPGNDLGLTSVVLATIALLWVFALLFAVYRWGGPEPIRRPAITAALVTGVIGLGTWGAMNVIPVEAAASVAVFGSLGIILTWLYGVGVVVVGAPIAVGSLLNVLDAGRQR